VFRGYDERNRRDVGIEALPPVLDPIASASLVTSLAKFEHANLVHVYELIVHAGKPYLITEPLAGKSLDQHIIDRGVYPWLEAVGLMDEVCAGLEYAHERSMLHRAIRPAVIIMQGKAAKLGGFAIAPDLTDADFVAPDVLSGAAPGRRSDIYAIGATLFQCLTGRSPSKDHELSNVPMKLQQLVDSMLAKTANDRPATVKDVRVSFKGLLDF
jgi:serine/threonine-protein kinase